MDQASRKPEARFIAPGELLAMAPSHILAGPSGMFWLPGMGSPPNERRGDVALVHVRGGLEHHESLMSDSYESIIKRVGAAMIETEEMEKPSAVVLVIDSPGGLVSGLNETVATLQKMRKNTGVKLVAYVNSMAASAAYALCCACKEVIAPRTAIVGSIGVISTMGSQAAADKKAGLDYRLIVSGDRKADGHPHQAISDGAVAAEKKRVDKLAADFFRLASKARKIPVDRIRGYQADIFLGMEAKRPGLIDAVMSLDEAIGALSKSPAPTPEPEAGGNETDRRAKNVLDSVRHTTSRSDTTSGTLRPEHHMPIQLDALIKRTEAKLAAETDPKRRAAIAADLATYAKTAAECDDDDDGEEDDEDEKKSKKAKAKGREEEKASAKSKKMEERKDEEGDEEEEEEASKAALALLEQQTGLKGSAAIGAAAGSFARLTRVEQQTAELSARQVESEKEGLLAKVKAHIPTTQHAWLSTQKIGTIRSFVAEATKGAPLVATAEGDLLIPRETTPGTEAALPKETRDLLEQMAAAVPEKEREAFRKTATERLLKDNAKALNGAAGRI